MFRQTSSAAEAAASEASTPCLSVGVRRCRWLRLRCFGMSSGCSASRLVEYVSVARDCSAWSGKRRGEEERDVGKPRPAFGVWRSLRKKHCVMVKRRNV